MRGRLTHLVYLTFYHMKMTIIELRVAHLYIYITLDTIRWYKSLFNDSIL